MAVNLSPVGGVAAQFFDNDGNVLSGGKIYTYGAGSSTPAVTYTNAAGVIQHANPIILDSAGRVPSGEIWLTDGIQYKFVIKNASDVLIGTYDNIIGINSNFFNYLAEQEIQTATANQTVFTLTTTQYQPGSNTLSVFVDGVNQYGPGAQYSYVETSSTVVTFNNGLHVGASVKFTTTQALSGGTTDSSLVTYQPAGTGAVETTVQAKLRQKVSVADFIPSGTNTATTDCGTYIQAAITHAASLGTSATVSIDGLYKLASNVNVTCDIDGSNGQLNVYTGGKLTFATSQVVGTNLTIQMLETFSAQVIQVSVPHVTLVEPRISYTINDEPLHTAINIAPPANPDGLWDVKVVRPYIRGCYQGIKLETTGGGSGGWITDVNISDATIIAFRLHAIRFNDAGAKGIAYCSVNNLTLENYGVNSLLKYGINSEGTCFGNSFTDIKDFNDDPLLGTYYTIYCVDSELNTLIAAGGSPTLANHIMAFTRNVFSNCRVEGNISLGPLRNMYSIRDVHIYNKVGILSLDGYDYYHDYGQDYISQVLDLSTATFVVGNPADATMSAQQNRLKVFMTNSAACQVRIALPQWFIDAVNSSDRCTVASVNNFYSQISAGSMNFNIRSGATNLPIDGTLPSTNMRTDKRLTVLTYNTSALTLASGDYIAFVFNGDAGETYTIEALNIYTALVNPVLDMTPFINTVY
jgi:hypothetical protein